MDSDVKDWEPIRSRVGRNPERAPATAKVRTQADGSLLITSHAGHGWRSAHRDCARKHLGNAPQLVWRNFWQAYGEGRKMVRTCWVAAPSPSSNIDTTGKDGE